MKIKAEMTAQVVEIFTVSLDEILTLGFKEAARVGKLRAQREEDRARAMALFATRDEARKVWDDWDGIEQIGEDAHLYLNLIGDGAYCAV